MELKVNKPKPQPVPPSTYTLTLTEQEARHLFRLCGSHIVGPLSVAPRGTFNRIYSLFEAEFGNDACTSLNESGDCLVVDCE